MRVGRGTRAHGTPRFPAGGPRRLRPVGEARGEGTRPWFRWRFRPWAVTRGSRGGARPRGEQRWAKLEVALGCRGPLGSSDQLPPRKRLTPVRPGGSDNFSFLRGGRFMNSENPPLCSPGCSSEGSLGRGHGARLLTVADPQGWRQGAARWRGLLRSWGLHHFRPHPTLLGIPGGGGGRVELVKYCILSWRDNGGRPAILSPLSGSWVSPMD